MWEEHVPPEQGGEGISSEIGEKNALAGGAMNFPSPWLIHGIKQLATHVWIDSCLDLQEKLLLRLFVNLFYSILLFEF